MSNNAPPQVIKTFADGSILEVGGGEFDNYCVYLTRPNVHRHRPKDYQYFNRLLKYAAQYGNGHIYQDFVTVYNLTGNQVQQNVLDTIAVLSQQYQNNAIDIEIDYTILYLGMIAEENKANAILGKRVKRLGVHQVLIDGVSPMYASQYSKRNTWLNTPNLLNHWHNLGNNIQFWQVLDGICRQKGF